MNKIKAYIKPESAIHQVKIETTMASVSGNGMGYGGVDTSGNITPSAKDREPEWEEM